MIYRINAKAGMRRFFTEARSNSRIPYFTVKEMKKRYPDHNFIIIGEIGGLAHASMDGDWLCLENGNKLLILPRGSLKRPIERVIGYVEVQGKYYITVIGGFLRLFSAWRYIWK